MDKIVKLSNPKIEGVAAWVWAAITKVSFTVSWVAVKLGVVFFRDTNSVICPAAATSPSTDHHNCSIATTPVTPES